MQKRYGALRFISGVYKAIGIIIGILTILSSVAFCATSVLGTSLLGGMAQNVQSSGLPLAFGVSGLVGGIIGAVITLIFGALSALGIYAFGELIALVISLEENTRQSAKALQVKPQ
jgi:hypothetical protein